ncbi:Uncharacterized protein HZ326_16907 [Fusarium oxysporum f. sp. albedinis]|nr:Uncharacterized protein HZ326_16907 [Fusarium oxysporum f. sp. albedinis]
MKKSEVSSRLLRGNPGNSGIVVPRKPVTLVFDATIKPNSAPTKQPYQGFITTSFRYPKSCLQLKERLPTHLIHPSARERKIAFRNSVFARKTSPTSVTWRRRLTYCKR